MAYMNLDDNPAMAEQMNRISSEIKSEELIKNTSLILAKEIDELKKEISAIKKVLAKNKIK